MRCKVCKGVMMPEVADYTTEINGEEIVMEEVPVWVCEQCEAVEIDPDVLEALEDMLASLRGGLGGENPPENIDLTDEE